MTGTLSMSSVIAPKRLQERQAMNLTKAISEALDTIRPSDNEHSASVVSTHLGECTASSSITLTPVRKWNTQLPQQHVCHCDPPPSPRQPPWKTKCQTQRPLLCTTTPGDLGGMFIISKRELINSLFAAKELRVGSRCASIRPGSKRSGMGTQTHQGLCHRQNSAPGRGEGRWQSSHPAFLTRNSNPYLLR